MSQAKPIANPKKRLCLRLGKGQQQMPRGQYITTNVEFVNKTQELPTFAKLQSLFSQRMVHCIGKKRLNCVDTVLLNCYFKNEVRNSWDDKFEF